jgi:hypothetical protein
MLDRPLTPTDTVYGKYRFRSRTEARWAVFLEHLQLAYTYEQQGFHLDNGLKYLPDFFLSKAKIGLFLMCLMWRRYPFRF